MLSYMALHHNKYAFFIFIFLFITHVVDLIVGHVYNLMILGRHGTHEGTNNPVQLWYSDGKFEIKYLLGLATTPSMILLVYRSLVFIINKRIYKINIKKWGSGVLFGTGILLITEPTIGKLVDKLFLLSDAVER